MTKEEKQLLLKDLCARLPYGVMCTDLRHGDSKITEIDIKSDLVYCADFDEYAEIEYYCKPYLRPMSSMTKEERFIYEQRLHDVGRSINVIDADDVVSHIDWLLAHHFDYRGLIEKGLALEAPEGMY